ncbi:MAG: cytochrome c3 family protein [Candidatus Palauibacterales bacterium]|nr:cytochrome c3 family protein [Candidatus Palauibacterales bacterium]MDP2529033.1 cytochrome c3 family protein [Candidatus Palauibacterales bacterium]MDP2583852.1 cytochrome c3 family protein [Candidatus Palauibacterales bacterium]
MSVRALVACFALALAAAPAGTAPGLAQGTQDAAPPRGDTIANAADTTGAASADTTGGAGAAQPEESCVSCHRSLDSERFSAPAKAFHNDIHASKGFGCVACHGGDDKDSGFGAMDPAKGFIGIPSRRDIPELCGRCHSDAQFMKRFNPSLRVDQVAEYRTSVHGRRLAAGDTLVATCADCHHIHSIRPPSDPKSNVYPVHVSQTCGRCHADADYMKPYGIPTDQLQKYEKSVHWATLSQKGDLSAPTCNDCHGSHGATPPGVSSVVNVCGQCHAVQAGRFEASFHSEIFSMIGAPGCVTCHGNHEIHAPTDAFLGVGDSAVCGRCHTADSKGAQVATGERSLIDSLADRMQVADSILGRAADAGMEVSQAQANLGNARNALIQARAAIHSFSVDSVRAKIDPGLEVADQSATRGRDALQELQVRRLGLAVSAALILLVIVMLVLKIHRAGRPTRPGEGKQRGNGGEGSHGR